jgi:hypothetical protein
LGIDFVNAARTGAAVANQASLFQYAKMLGDGGAGDGEDGSEFIDGVGMARKQLEDGEAGGIAKGLQAGGNVSIHLR